MSPMEEAHRDSLAALRSATLLRRAKAALLFTVSGAIVFAVVAPLCLDRPRTWFGVEFGPVPSADARVATIERESKAFDERLARAASDIDLVYVGLQRRIESLDRRVDPIERRCMVESRSITIARDDTPVAASVPSRVALLHVQPIAYDEYRAMTSYAERWIDPDDLEKPNVLLRGMPADTTELRLQLTWLGGDGTTIGRTVSVFTKTAGRWDKLEQVAKCADVDPALEKLAELRIRMHP